MKMIAMYSIGNGSCICWHDSNLNKINLGSRCLLCGALKVHTNSSAGGNWACILWSVNAENNNNPLRQNTLAAELRRMAMDIKYNMNCRGLILDIYLAIYLVGCLSVCRLPWPTTTTDRFINSPLHRQADTLLVAALAIRYCNVTLFV